MTRTPHPDFLRAPAEHQWADTLEALFERLVKEAYTLQGGTAWRILPGGALVSLEIRPQDFRKRLRIARSSAPADDAAKAAWSQEITTFLAHFGGPRAWDMTTGEQPDGGIACYLLSRFPVAPEHKEDLMCARCGGPAPEDSRSYREPICHGCALALGREEAAAVRERTRAR